MESPGTNKPKDPFARKPVSEGPPDLDELLAKLAKRLAGFFATFTKKPSGKAWYLLLLVVIIGWLLSGIFIVPPTDKAVVTRFGKYVKTAGPGPHWLLRFVESKQQANVKRIATYPYNEELLTADQNIANIALVVNYQIGDVENYFFNAKEPELELREAITSATSQIVGEYAFDTITTIDPNILREKIKEQLAKMLQQTNSGLAITDLTIMPVKPPEAVNEAFAEVEQARVDAKRYFDEATAYQQQTVANSKQQSEDLLAKASAYKEQVVLDAKAEVAPFLAMLPQYEKSPTIIGKKLYLETMQSVLKNNKKIWVDAKDLQNVLHLSFDNIISQASDTKKDQVKTPSEETAQEKSVLGNDRPDRRGYSNGVITHAED